MRGCEDRNVQHQRYSPRLRYLLEWLRKRAARRRLPAGAQGARRQVPARSIEAAGYGALWVGQPSWNGVAILAEGMTPVESRRALPGDASDTQSRYLEAAAHGVLVGCLYLPNGNPQPGPKFDYKLAWFERLLAHAQALYGRGHPVALVGDYNVVPTRLRHLQHAVLAEERAVAARAASLLPALVGARLDGRGQRTHPDEPVYTFWDYFRQHWETNSGLRIDHLLLNKTAAPRLKRPAWIAGFAARRAPAIMRRHASSWARRTVSVD